MTAFEGCTLYISARSPFARRVRVAFLEQGLRFEAVVLNVFEPNPELLEVNPLARVPAVRLKSGQTIADSNWILAALRSGRAISVDECHWSGLAAGLCEKIVEFYLETLRPEAKRDAEVLDECRRAFDGVLTELEACLKTGPGPWVLGADFSQADVDLGCALGYLSLRGGTTWRERCPLSAAYLERLEARPSFAATRPPA